MLKIIHFSLCVVREKTLKQFYLELKNEFYRKFKDIRFKSLHVIQIA